MNLEEIKEIAASNMAARRSHLEREPGYTFHHGVRTAGLAGEIMGVVSGSPAASDPVLYVGALFHDVGKGFSSHHETGAHLAKHLLSQQCTHGELEGICNIIRYHCIRKQGLELDEGILAVQDADMIDHFGTQEIWLNFLYRAYKHGTQLESIRYWESEQYREQTAKLRGLLNFDISRKLFDDRVKFQELFLDRLKLEAEGRIPDEYLA